MEKKLKRKIKMLCELMHAKAECERAIIMAMSEEEKNAFRDILEEINLKIKRV
jgi:hypothetical protein